jgi:hypothetical protein
MATVGLIAIIAVGLVVFVAIIFALMSVPDLRRYRRIRNM